MSVEEELAAAIGLAIAEAYYLRGARVRLNEVSVTTGTVEWPQVGAPTPPSADSEVVRHLPVEDHMLNEATWVSQHLLGEKA